VDDKFSQKMRKIYTRNTSREPLKRGHLRQLLRSPGLLNTPLLLTIAATVCLSVVQVSFVCRAFT